MADHIGSEDNLTSHVYVIEFSSGRVKVGFSTDPTTRLALHASTARAYGTPIVRSWVSPPHVNAEANEKRLIDFCRFYRGSDGVGEYFGGVPYDDVVSYTTSALKFKTTPQSVPAREHRRNFVAERAALSYQAEMNAVAIRRRIIAELLESTADTRYVLAYIRTFEREIVPDPTLGGAVLTDGELERIGRLVALVCLRAEILVLDGISLTFKQWLQIARHELDFKKRVNSILEQTQASGSR